MVHKELLEHERKYKKYTEEDMQEAIEMVKAGSTISAASRETGVPRKTLEDKDKDNRPNQSTLSSTSIQGTTLDNSIPLKPTTDPTASTSATSFWPSPLQGFVPQHIDLFVTPLISKEKKKSTKVITTGRVIITSDEYRQKLIEKQDKERKDQEEKEAW